MDVIELGARIKTARERRAHTQDSLGAAVGLDRYAIRLIERGGRSVKVQELLAIADALERPLSYFVAPAVPAVISRRQDAQHAHAISGDLEDELRLFSSDVAGLLSQGVLVGRQRADFEFATPRDHITAEQRANSIRDSVGLSASAHVEDVDALAEHFGMLTYTAKLPNEGQDGACVEVGPEAAQLGVAVVNGGNTMARRRMTVAHELGHWLTGDAYDRSAFGNAEAMINSFAIHLLVPRAGVMQEWNKNPGASPRERALRVGARFWVSWSAAVGQLRNLGLIDTADFNRLADQLPTAGEFAQLGLTLHTDIPYPYLSPGFTADVLTAYTRRALTKERTLELLRGTLGEDDLPPQADRSLADLAEAFSGHDE